MGENKPWYVKVDEWVQGILAATLSVGMLFSAPVLFLIAFVAKVATFLLSIARKVCAFVLGLFGIDILSDDPFYLRRYGDSLLTSAVRSDLKDFNTVLWLLYWFELFAWGSMWSYVGETLISGVWGVLIGIALLVMPLIFARLTIVVDRGILVMDTPSVKRRFIIIMSRVFLLFFFSLLNAVPVELRVFASEIDRVREDAEKVEVDAIREKAKAYETERAESQKATAAPTVTGQADDVVARRQADRAGIEQRIEVAQKATARVAAGKGVSRRNQATALASAQKQEADIRAELVAFDAETERMRSAAADKGTDELARRDDALAAKLFDIEAMPAEDLAAAYGGTYKMPNGFMARYRTLLEIIEQDGKNQAIAWGCRLLMVLVGIMVLWSKFARTSPDTREYYRFLSQGFANNPEVVPYYIRIAKESGRPKVEHDQAMNVLRAVAGNNPAAAAALASLGYGGNVDVAGWDTEVFDLHGQFARACSCAARAYAEYESAFSALCTERVAHVGGLTAFGLARAEIVKSARAEWNRLAQGAIDGLSTVERRMYSKGIRVPGWPSELVEGDPRRKPILWDLSDEVLEQEWGWLRPIDEQFRSAPNA